MVTRPCRRPVTPGGPVTFVDPRRPHRWAVSGRRETRLRGGNRNCPPLCRKVALTGLLRRCLSVPTGRLENDSAACLTRCLGLSQVSFHIERSDASFSAEQHVWSRDHPTSGVAASRARPWPVRRDVPRGTFRAARTTGAQQTK